MHPCFVSIPGRVEIRFDSKNQLPLSSHSTKHVDCRIGVNAAAREPQLCGYNQDSRVVLSLPIELDLPDLPIGIPFVAWDFLPPCGRELLEYLVLTRNGMSCMIVQVFDD